MMHISIINSGLWGYFFLIRDIKGFFSLFQFWIVARFKMYFLLWSWTHHIRLTLLSTAEHWTVFWSVQDFCAIVEAKNAWLLLPFSKFVMQLRSLCYTKKTKKKTPTLIGKIAIAQNGRFRKGLKFRKTASSKFISTTTKIAKSWKDW